MFYHVESQTKRITKQPEVRHASPSEYMKDENQTSVDVTQQKRELYKKIMAAKAEKKGKTKKSINKETYLKKDNYNTIILQCFYLQRRYCTVWPD